MHISLIDSYHRSLKAAIPLTNGTGKTRIKKRSSSNQYGNPVSTKQEAFSSQCYMEWQIGYDVTAADAVKLKLTTLPDITFTGANSKTKALYELSEYVYYFYKWNAIAKKDLEALKIFLARLADKHFINNPSKFAIGRTSPAATTVCGIGFDYMQVQYPLLIHRFGTGGILVEIKITEKQRAIGGQPMLYFCLPITLLAAHPPLLGRTAETNETAHFVIIEKNIGIFLQMLKIFGMLSKAHRHDIVEIIDVILT